MNQDTIKRNYEKELQITLERLYKETTENISVRAALEDLYEENKLLKQEIERLKDEKEEKEEKDTPK